MSGSPLARVTCSRLAQSVTLPLDDKKHKIAALRLWSTIRVARINTRLLFYSLTDYSTVLTAVRRRIGLRAPLEHSHRRLQCRTLLEALRTTGLLEEASRVLSRSDTRAATGRHTLGCTVHLYLLYVHSCRTFKFSWQHKSASLRSAGEPRPRRRHFRTPEPRPSTKSI